MKSNTHNHNIVVIATSGTTTILWNLGWLVEQTEFPSKCISCKNVSNQFGANTKKRSKAYSIKKSPNHTFSNCFIIQKVDGGLRLSNFVGRKLLAIVGEHLSARELEIPSDFSGFFVVIFQIQTGSQAFEIKSFYLTLWT